MWSKLRKATNTVFLQSDAAATIYFGACFVRLLFILLLVGRYYSRAAFISFKSFGLCGYYLRAATIWGWPLFEGGHYLRAATIWGRLLSEGGYYLRVATIWGWPLFEGGIFSKKYGTSSKSIYKFLDSDCKCFFYKPRLRDYPLCAASRTHHCMWGYPVCTSKNLLVSTCFWSVTSSPRLLETFLH